jgi:alpha-beta hydrolase superfamily lysophospholipase
VGTTRKVEVSAGIELFCETWEPEGDPKFVVVISHGQGEHVSRYDEVAADFNAQGGLVFGADHRGQGRSGGTKGYVKRFEDYAADLLSLIKIVAAERPESQRPESIPWFLFGHSMGGLIALAYLLDHERTIPLRGAIISSPLLEPIVKGAAAKKVLASFLVRVTPKLSIPVNLDKSHLFRDDARLARYLEDDVGYDPLTPGWAKAFDAIKERVYAGAQSIQLPMLWYVGTGDLLVAAQPTIDFFNRIPGTKERDQTLRVFEGYYHELHNEGPQLRKPVMDLAVGWVVDHS